jgi:cytochrome c553
MQSTLRKTTLATLAMGLLVSLSVMAQPAIFKEADLKLGEELIAVNQCTACHQRREGGDGSSIYKPQGRINSPAFLRGMVEYCNTELNLGLFPEEVSAIAAVLNRDHYKFK